MSLQLYLLTQEGRTVLELYLVLTGAMVNGLRNGWVKIMIAIMEFYPIVLSLMLWSDHIRDRCITSGADPGFFLGGGALVSCSTSTPINHNFFFGRIPVVLENRRSYQGAGGVRTPCTLPLDPPLYILY